MMSTDDCAPAGHRFGLDPEDLPKLEAESIEELTDRVRLGSFLIAQLERDDDPRAPEAVKNLTEQQRQLNGIINRKQEEQGKPEPVSVSMSTAHTRARRQAI